MAAETAGLALRRFLGWLAAPRRTWQQRWQARAPATVRRTGGRRSVAARDRPGAGNRTEEVQLGLGQLIYADAIRPGTAWLMNTPTRFPLGREMPRLRDRPASRS